MSKTASTFWLVSISIGFYSVYRQTTIDNVKSIHFSLVPFLYAYTFTKTAFLLIFQLLFFPVWPFIWTLKLIWVAFIAEPFSIIHKSLVAIYPALLFFAVAIGCGFFIGALGRVIMEISSAMLVVHFDDKPVKQQQQQQQRRKKQLEEVVEYDGDSDDLGEEQSVIDKQREREELLSLVEEWRRKQQHKSRSSSISSNASSFFSRSNGLLSHGGGLTMLASDNDLKRQ